MFFFLKKLFCNSNLSQEIIREGVENHGQGIYTIPTFLTDIECDKYINLFASDDFETASINTGSDFEIIESVRNNQRVMFDDTDLAANLFREITKYLPERHSGWTLSGLNERFRLYKYETGQYFDWHQDGSYQRSKDEASFLSVLFYLNEDFKGGETKFKGLKIKPSKGSALVFPHALMHSGATLEKGVKYVLRTDVIYSKFL